MTMTLDLAAVERAATRLALIAEYHAGRTTFAYVREVEGERARRYRHIAADAASANDPECPCGASLASVTEFLAGDDELAREVEKTP